jgi:hypothetical protein
MRPQLGSGRIETRADVQWLAPGLLGSLAFMSHGWSGPFASPLPGNQLPTLYEVLRLYLT